MGEPLANYKAGDGALDHRAGAVGSGNSQRSVTVSTVGVAPAIRKLAEEKLQVRLAVSLHRPDGKALRYELDGVHWPDAPRRPFGMEAPQFVRGVDV